MKRRKTKKSGLIIALLILIIIAAAALLCATILGIMKTRQLDQNTQPVNTPESVSAVEPTAEPAAEPEQTPEYILVLGAKIRGTEPSLILKERLDAAVSYYRRNRNRLTFMQIS